MTELKEKDTMKSSWYTIIVGILFLSVACGSVYVMFFVPMPTENEKPIMLTMGSIMTAAIIAMNNLARGGSTEIELKLEVAKLKEVVKSQAETIDKLINKLLTPEEAAILRIEGP